ncbi:MAG: hypothetical protein Q7V43_21980 [Myxococcales bacterium]|nr:hypothetical protein [Myxococcales bacterium]
MTTRYSSVQRATPTAPVTLVELLETARAALEAMSSSWPDRWPKVTATVSRFEQDSEFGLSVYPRLVIEEGRALSEYSDDDIFDMLNAFDKSFGVQAHGRLHQRDCIVLSGVRDSKDIGNGAG